MYCSCAVTIVFAESKAFVFSPKGIVNVFLYIGSIYVSILYIFTYIMCLFIRRNVCTPAKQWQPMVSVHQMRTSPLVRLCSKHTRAQYRLNYFFKYAGPRGDLHFLGSVLGIFFAGNPRLPLSPVRCCVLYANTFSKFFSHSCGGSRD